MNPKAPHRLGTGCDGGKEVLREKFFDGFDTFEILFKEAKAKHIPGAKDPFDTQNFHVKKNKQAFSITQLIQGQDTA